MSEQTAAKEYARRIAAGQITVTKESAINQETNEETFFDVIQDAELNCFAALVSSPTSPPEAHTLRQLFAPRWERAYLKARQSGAGAAADANGPVSV